MKSLAARRRHPLAAFVVLFLALVTMGGLYTAFAPSQRAEAAPGVSAQQVEKGRLLFVNGCSTCHGMQAQGTGSAPSLIGVGAAAVDFQVSTGRMPADQPDVAQSQPKPPVYSEKETAALAAYVGSLGLGPAIPAEHQYAYRGADVAEGGELFRTNCATCHNFAGEGGALTEGKSAPKLTDSTPKLMYEAMVTGPASMPVFNDGAIPDEQKKEIIAYVKHVQEQPNEGGYGLGRLGPVTEGLFLWTVGLGALIGVAVWIGAKSS
ncbi:MAG: cytochrome bc1 complex diheme cytochrome c subunit [Carbonactinosporaceae bacterium]